MEDAGRVRRGYFIAGLGAAQFAALGAEDQLREFRDPPEVREFETAVLAATDPANPWGNALSWPDTPQTGRPQRVAGARVFVTNGHLSAWLNRNNDQLTTFKSADSDNESWQRSLVGALARLTKQRRSLLITRVDGETPQQSHLSRVLLAAGFVSTTKGFLHRGNVHDA